MHANQPEMLEIHEEGSYLLVVFTGQFSLEQVRRVVDRIAQACSDLDRSRVLLDVRRMTGKITIMGRYKSTVYGLKLVGSVVMLVIVGSREAIHPDHFLETVAVNRGLNLRLFIDIEAAIAWLKS